MFSVYKSWPKMDRLLLKQNFLSDGIAQGAQRKKMHFFRDENPFTKKIYKNLD